MYNWNTDTSWLEKDTDAYAIWKLEQMINFGLDGEKLDKTLLIQYWDRLRIDEKKRNALAYLLWRKRS